MSPGPDITDILLEVEAGKLSAHAAMELVSGMEKDLG